MRKQALSALIVCLSAGALSAGFSLGRPAAVKRQVLKLDDKVLAARAAKAAQAGTNRAPVISGITAVSATVAAGGLTAVSVSASDPDGDTLSYLWTSTVGALGGAAKASGNWLAPSTPGVYAVTCTVSDGKVPVSSSVVVMAVTPGTAKWQFTASANISQSPAVGPDGTVYVVDDSGKLYALSRDGSQKNWSPFTGITDTITFPPVIGADGTLYLVAAGTKTYAVNPDGSKKWGPSATIPVNAVVDPPVVGSDGEVYLFDALASTLYEFDQATGLGRSTFTDLPGIAVAPVIGPDGTLYVADTGGSLYSIPPGKGLAESTSTTVTGISRAPAIGADGTVYWVDSDTSLNAANPDGTSKWAGPFSPGSAIADRPILGADGAIYLLDSNPNAWHISSATEAGHQITSVANVAMLPAPAPDGSAYMIDASSPWNIYSVKSSDSNDTLKWGPFFVPAPGTAINARPAVEADGTLYFPSNDKKLYAVYGASALPAP